MPVTTTADRVTLGSTVRLFDPGGPFAASRDGQRFLTSPIVTDPSPITILLHWAGARRPQ